MPSGVAFNEMPNFSVEKIQIHGLKILLSKFLKHVTEIKLYSSH